MKKWVIILIVIITILVTAIAWSLVLSSFIIKKPAIYLYPEDDSYIDVFLEINGRITKDIPKYNEGWRVFARKDGLLNDKFDYLYYEADLKKIELPEEGWVVDYSDLESWFNEYLVKLGLNEKEKKQFMEYWMAELPESKYYEIKLLTEDYMKKNMNLIVLPEPDNVIRLNFHFRRLNKKTSISEPQIITPERSGFVVVEWGGILR
jgi:hypothetical protein